MKIRYSELRKIVVEEMKNLGLLPLTEGDKSDLESVEDKKAKEIEPGDEADQLEMPIDALKARKIKEQKLRAHEAKLLKALGETRSQIKRVTNSGK